MNGNATCTYCGHGFNQNYPLYEGGMHEHCFEHYNQDMDILLGDDEGHFEDDGQPSEYDEWQDYFGGDDWDHGQYDEGEW